MAHSSPKEMQRLDKCVSHLTGMSRQMASKLIKDGAVSVDGELITKPMTKVSINSQIVIDGYSETINSSAASTEFNEWDEDGNTQSNLSTTAANTDISHDGDNGTHGSKSDDADDSDSDNCYDDSAYDDDPVADASADTANDAELDEFADADDNPLLNQRVVINTTVANAFKKRVFLMNKPCGYVCSSSDRNHAIVSTLWSRERHSNKLQTIGRLDVDTTGLLLFTDDGELNHALTSPKKQVTKLYLARLNRSVPPQAVKQFAHGIKHPEEAKRYQSAQLTILDPSLISKVEGALLHCPAKQSKINAHTLTDPSQQLAPKSMELNNSMAENVTHTAAVNAANNTASMDSANSAQASTEANASASAATTAPRAQPCYWAAVQLNEGRYHEVKRLFEVVGCEVLELVRVAIGSLLLPQGLTLGSYVALSADDLKLANTNREFSPDELLELWERYQSNLKASQPRFLYYFNTQA